MERRKMIITDGEHELSDFAEEFLREVMEQGYQWMRLDAAYDSKTRERTAMVICAYKEDPRDGNDEKMEDDWDMDRIDRNHKVEYFPYPIAHLFSGVVPENVFLEIEAVLMKNYLTFHFEEKEDMAKFRRELKENREYQTFRKQLDGEE